MHLVCVGGDRFTRCVRDRAGLTDLTAADLGAPAGEPAPVFMDCRKLTLIRLPVRRQAIPARMFRRCIRLAVADLIAGSHLSSNGNGAFSACFHLDRMALPATVRRSGGSAFLASGLKAIKADAFPWKSGRGRLRDAHRWPRRASVFPRWAWSCLPAVVARPPSRFSGLMLATRSRCAGAMCRRLGEVAASVL
jgi:hypothetical protein